MSLWKTRADALQINYLFPYANQNPIKNFDPYGLFSVLPNDNFGIVEDSTAENVCAISDDEIDRCLPALIKCETSGIGTAICQSAYRTCLETGSLDMIFPGFGRIRPIDR